MKKPVEDWITDTVGSSAVRLDGECRFKECNAGGSQFVFSHSILKVKNYAKTKNQSNQNQIQPSKPKREITEITNSQNTYNKNLWSTE